MAQNIYNINTYRRLPEGWDIMLPTVRAAIYQKHPGISTHAAEELSSKLVLKGAEILNEGRIDITNRKRASNYFYTTFVNDLSYHKNLEIKTQQAVDRLDVDTAFVGSEEGSLTLEPVIADTPETLLTEEEETKGRYDSTIEFKQKLEELYTIAKINEPTSELKFHTLQMMVNKGWRAPTIELDDFITTTIQNVEKSGYSYRRRQDALVTKDITHLARLLIMDGTCLTADDVVRYITSTGKYHDIKSTRCIAAGRVRHLWYGTKIDSIARSLGDYDWPLTNPKGSPTHRERAIVVLEKLMTDFHQIFITEGSRALISKLSVNSFIAEIRVNRIVYNNTEVVRLFKAYVQKQSNNAQPWDQRTINTIIRHKIKADTF